MTTVISAPDFSTYTNFDWIAAIRERIALARGRVAEIKASGKTDFSLIAGLETCDEELGQVLEVFYSLLGTDTTDAMQALAQEIGPISAEFSSEISQDVELFRLVDALWAKRDGIKDPAQYACLEKHWKGFVRNGALLDDAGKAQLKAIDAEMSKLGPRFSDNMRKSAKAYQLVITAPADLAGLPESAVAAAREEAEAKGHKDAWLFTLDHPSYVPFMTYADNRELREQMWRAFAARAYGDDFDNRALAKEIVGLRHARARLLGYAGHADFVLERRMAETPERVFAFLDRLKSVALPAARRELEELRAFAGTDLKPWDVGYYSEKLKQKKYAFDSERLRPYFPVDAVLKGCFAHCEKLFGLSFRESGAYSVYHPDVKPFDVVDSATGTPLGLLYADFFPRDGKNSGAWQGTFRERRIMRDGNTGLPLSVIVCNFTKPTKDKPSLLSFDEVETLFHEMGHALHTLLTTIDYPSISGTSVYWDFVELPSQIMENWLTEKETLDIFARHYETGETIPQQLIDALKKSQNFMAGWFVMRQLQFCLLDMTWHTADPASIGDVLTFERGVLDPLALLPYEAGCVSTSFSHIFAGGYSAGYYSYQWAEVLDADAFSLFKEKGLYDPATGRAFRDRVLALGGSRPPLDLFRDFRGREPDPDASLRRRGLLDAA
ncbi:MAG: M3 family metallopeptidase [Rhodospirillales bacterium]|nr:M3 family metallopeptidase [Alphaproteobacteria bacterium]MCB9986233.1 M3 family metallopeptidase [Rhodospirillales bacterium]USO07212.1 MAG: M3 family metallopeptidase [Rhodospirillales bacterium]